MKDKALFLFTDSFPYGRFEPYLEDEIILLSKLFKKVFVFPINTDLPFSREVPGNFIVVNIHQEVKSKKIQFIKSLSLLYKLFYQEKKSLALRNFKTTLRIAYNAYCYCCAIESYIINNQLEKQYSITGYSYWFYQWSLINSILRAKGVLSYAFSRAHSYDLYDYIKYNWFAHFKVKYLDKVYPVSKHGTEYLKQKHSTHGSKIETNYLGTYDFGINTNIKNGNDLVICSCSAVRDIKRIDIIIRALCGVKLNVKWFHFGDGPLYTETKNLAEKILPENIKTQFFGHVPNKDIIRFYQENRVDLFINVSEKEGLPISLVEAISFGIPVIGPQIFGIPEIVNSSTGILLPHGFTYNHITSIINEFPFTNKTSESFRLQTREYWKENFDKNKNLQKLRLY